MKYQLIIDTEKEESVVVTAHKISKLTDSIEAMVLSDNTKLMGYDDSKRVYPINLSEVLYFKVDDSKVYAQTNIGKLLIRKRLFELEELAGSGFVKINQSCIVRIKSIRRFDCSLFGTLLVEMSDGYKDYVSRRQMSAVKERIGI